MNNNQEKITQYLCPICGNANPVSIGIRNGKPYCRKCLTFRGQEVSNDYIQNTNAEYELHYELSAEQKKLSKQLVNNYKKGINSLVHAVCGSGKTEIVLEIIKYAIEHNLKVGFAVPRRDVAIELCSRFKSIFTKNKIVLLYGGHTKELEGDLVCLTTHQLFRYNNYFDLIVMDEIDAFPYKGNDTLEAMFKRSLKGHYVFLSATPDEEFINQFKKDGGDVLELNIRFHRHPLPVPEVILKNRYFQFLSLVGILKEFVRHNKPVFIFTPTIDICENVFNLLKIFIKNGNYVHSKHPNRGKVIDDFRKGKHKYLVTTAVLERGVTIKDLQVVIYHADHSIYDSYSLVQISGRVGRKIDAPEGRVIYLAERFTNEMDKSIKDISKSNKELQNVF